MGFRREPNEEATFFRRLNDSILSRHAAYWNHPKPFRQLLDNNTDVKKLAQEMHRKIRQLPALEYWGPLLRPGIERKHPYWGWKDPRMNIVLPVWLELFPEATVIQVVRNGVDVASSLKSRDIRMREENRKNLPIKYPSLMENFQLWCEYMEFSDNALHNWQGNRFTFQYESLLESPQTIISDLGNFLDLETPLSLSGIINTARKYAFLDNPELLELYQQVKQHPYMVKYNYHHISD